MSDTLRFLFSPAYRRKQREAQQTYQQTALDETLAGFQSTILNEVNAGRRRGYWLHAFMLTAFLVVGVGASMTLSLNMSGDESESSYIELNRTAHRQFVDKLPEFFVENNFDLNTMQLYLKLLDRAQVCMPEMCRVFWESTGSQDYYTNPIVVMEQDAGGNGYAIVLGTRFTVQSDLPEAVSYTPRFVVYGWHFMDTMYRADEDGQFYRDDIIDGWKPVEDKFYGGFKASVLRQVAESL